MMIGNQAVAQRKDGMKDTELLRAILSKVEGLERVLTRQDERRVSVREFASRMNISEKEMYDRIKNGRIKSPTKDGRKNYWLNSYVNDVVIDKAC